MNDSPVSFLIFVAIMAGLAYLIYRVGKRSTACGVTLGLLFVVVLVIVIIVTAQVTWQIQLTPR